MKKIILWAVPALLALASCQNESVVSDALVGVPVTFTQTASVRVSGTSWDSNDTIGVFMTGAGTTTAASSTLNAPYVTLSGDGAFTPAPTPLYYPTDASSVDFYAYYPYSPSRVSGSTYHIDLTAADATADFLYSNTAKSWNATAQTGALTFTRQLSSLVLTITTDSTLDSSDALSVTMSGLPTVASFDLYSGALSVISGSEATYGVSVTGSGRSYTATLPVLPGSSSDAATLTFTTASGKTRTASLPSGISFVAGSAVQLNVNVSGLASGDTSSVVAEYISWRETPVITTSQLSGNRYVIHYMPNDATARNYSMLYSPTYKMAYWVAYPLTTSMVGSSGRTNDWEYDPLIPQNEQADLSSGYAGSGYDRGHQLPSADRTFSTEVNRTTFYYSNMTPQNSKLNQQIWANLETKVRSWASGTDTLFVVTGAMPTTATDQTVNYGADRNGTAVAIPKYYFKALARRQGGVFYTIAFKFDNIAPTVSSTAYMDFTLSVAELEAMTGFTFFPSLDASTKASVNTSMWQ